MTTLGTASILRANARAIPLPDNSVDLIVTSPPYFALRSYQDGGEHYAGQIGDEPTPAEFVSSLLEVTAECVRVLKPSGSLWVNLGDKYSRGSRPLAQPDQFRAVDAGVTFEDERYRKDMQPENSGVAGKSLIGIPWRYALRCIDDLGLILRAEVIWSKPNGLPESVTDRVRRSHEQWFCFEQSGGVESVSEALPFCPLCGRPVDARSTLVQRLKEANGGVVPSDLADKVGPDESVQPDSASGTNLDIGGVARGASVAELVEGDLAGSQDAAHFLEDGVVAVEDEHAEVRVPVGGAGQADRSLPVDDASEPREVCDCVGHPLILNDEPWIPQSLAAEVMQSVADGECDAQQAADFLAGDYARNHSVWFHFTLEPRYFSAVDEIREEHKPGQSPAALSFNRDGRGTAPVQSVAPHRVGRDDQGLNPLGKLPGSVWTVATEPLKVPTELGIDHFAAFPTEWPRRIIQGWSPAGVCTHCGEGRRPISSSSTVFDKARDQAHAAEIAARGAAHSVMSGGTAKSTLNGITTRTITGYACACPEPSAPTTPAVVLDPFGGTGTTAMVAKALGRHGISVDMSADYCRLATWRTNDRDQLAKVLGIAKNPDPVDEHQLDLFGEVPA